MKAVNRTLAIGNKLSEARRVLGIAAIAIWLLTSGVPASGQEVTATKTMKWTVSAGGGGATAFATDTSEILLSGTGTFATTGAKTGPLFGFSPRVTGGGAWETFDKDGNSTGKGTFKVISLVRFVLAPGLCTVGTVVDPTLRAGLAVFRIEYSDGEKGFLAVSCNLPPPFCNPPGTPPDVLEGAHATKGFVDYFNAVSHTAFFNTIE